MRKISVLSGNCIKEFITDPSDKAELTSSEKERKLLLEKKADQNLRIRYLQVYWALLPHTSQLPIPLFRIPFLPINGLTLTEETL